MNQLGGGFSDEQIGGGPESQSNIQSPIWVRESNSETKTYSITLIILITILLVTILALIIFLLCKSPKGNIHGRENQSTMN